MNILKTKLRVAIKTYREKGLIALIRKIIHFLTQPRLRWEDFLWMLFRLKTIDNKIIATIHGQKMYLNPNDFGISKELAIYKTHEPLATKLLKNLLREGMTVVDVGANIGYYVLVESQIVGSKGKIIAIEPQQENVKFLRLNVEKNHLQNVRIIEAAIGDSCRQEKLYVNKRASNIHSLVPFHNNESQDEWDVQEVKVYSIDALTEELNSPIDFIRMDIEGYELNVIKGMGKTLKRHRSSLMIELHYDMLGRSGVIELLNILKQNEYRVKYISDRDKDFAWIKNKKIITTLNMDLLAKEKTFRVATVFFEKI